MAARAAPHEDFESPPHANGEGLSPPSDPLQRLEAELGEGDGGQSGDERLYEEAQGLVEEAWNVLSECLSIREGLLDACQEIERTMDGMQRRLSAMAVATEPNGREPGGLEPGGPGLGGPGLGGPEPDDPQSSSNRGRVAASSSNGAISR
jgi:hypothetical protein